MFSNKWVQPGAPRGSFHIRPISTEDISRLVVIDAASNPSSWNHAQFERELEIPFSISRVVHLHGEPVAFAVMWQVAQVAQLLEVAVLPEHRRKGIATFLVEHLLDVARGRGCVKMELEFRKGNGAAESLYQKFGFREVGYRKNFYDDKKDSDRVSSDAILMEKSL